MTRRVTWTNNSSDYDGTYVYRAETLDPQALPAPVATVDPVAQGETAEWVDNEELAAGDYDYAVQDVDGSGVSALSAVEVYTAPENYENANIGDYIGGGVYAGTHTDGQETWHLVFGTQDSEAESLSWGNDGTVTGADDPDDGEGNQDLILASFDNGDSDAFYHCRDYIDADGNSDYYIPSENELAKADALVDMSHAEFSSGLATYRWSSTESNSSNARSRRLSDSGIGNSPKSSTSLRVRPARRVLI